MTPINKVPTGKFCRFSDRIVYICYNNLKDHYILLPIEGMIPQDKAFNHGVYVYKRMKKDWIERAKDLIESNHAEHRIDNLIYIENLDILKSYGN